jgi:glycogen debranching enzyme
MTTGRVPATLLALLIVAVPQPTSAQELVVEKFPIETSALTLSGDVRPHQYLGVLGRNAAWLGTETGAAEVWVHPLKLLSDFRLSFRIPDYADPIRGEDVARTVIVRPELTTIVYSHATFTVKQHILAPHEAPGVLVLLDVDSFRPLEVMGTFQAAFQYAWPAAFGGQYAFFDGNARAFVLSESRARLNAVIGSPWITSASDHPAHSAPEAPSVFRIEVDRERARREFIPIAIAAGEMSRDRLMEEYRELITGAEALYRAKVDHVRGVLGSVVKIDTPDDELDRALAWAALNLDEQVVCNPDLAGCGLVAGWGPSGKGTRPGFGWFFGGDAAINSFAMDVLGLTESVADGLRFLAAYQRADGKMPHEISQAAARVRWFEDFPYPYYHADTTPYWIVAVWRYWLSTGDDGFVDEMWPALESAFAWGLGRDTDGDGIIENGPGNLGAIEVGALGEGIHQDVYLAAVWIEALRAVSEMAAARGEDALAGRASAMRERAHRRLNDGYWRPDEEHHAFGILESGETNDNLTVWPATALSFELLDRDRAVQTLRKLASDSISSDWGAHILSRASPLYDPMHYNNGAVWGFVTGFVAWAQYNYARPWAGYPLIDAMKQTGLDFARGRHPELISGTYYRPLDTAVPQQFFATSMLVSPLLRGMVGWAPDAPRGRARLGPQLPPDWTEMEVRGLRAGDARVDATFSRTSGRRSVALTSTGAPLTVRVDLVLPPGAEAASLFVDGAPVDLAEASDRPDRVGTDVDVGPEPTEVELRWRGGLEVVPPVQELEVGQESIGLRVLDFSWDGQGWDLVVEGQSGRSYVLALVGPRPSAVTGAEILDSAGSPTDPERTSLRIAIEGSEPRATRTVRILP